MIEKYASHYLWATFALARIYANKSMWTVRDRHCRGITSRKHSRAFHTIHVNIDAP